MIVFYFVATVVGFYLSAVWSAGLSVGASAGIFGLIGAMIALGVRHRAHPMGAAIRSLYIRWAMYGLMMGLLPGIDNAAHIGGLVGGFVVRLRRGNAQAGGNLGRAVLARRRVRRHRAHRATRSSECTSGLLLRWALNRKRSARSPGPAAPGSSFRESCRTAGGRSLVCPAADAAHAALTIGTRSRSTTRPVGSWNTQVISTSFTVRSPAFVIWPVISTSIWRAKFSLAAMLTSLSLSEPART